MPVGVRIDDIIGKIEKLLKDNNDPIYMDSDQVTWYNSAIIDCIEQLKKIKAL